MNIAEYVEQNMDDTSCRLMVIYHDFAKKAGLKDIQDICLVKELVESDLQELYKCRIILSNGFNDLQSCLVQELFWTESFVMIEFSHWTHMLRSENEHWLSDILKQTRMNNYIVRGERI